MTALAKVQNGTQLPSLSSWMEEWFNKDVSSMGPLAGHGVTVPKVNISEFGDQYILELAAPGLKKKDFKIKIDDGQLTISAELEEKDDSSQGQYTRREYSYRSFKRIFKLPDSIATEKIKANYLDGIIEITMPKREEAKKQPARVIDVK